MAEPSSAPAAAPEGLGEEGAAPRDEQVQSAVQFLTHPKTQNASLEDRKKFLVKKGLTEPEIEEAIRLAQPQLDQQQQAAERTRQASSRPAPGVFAEQVPSAKPLAAASRQGGADARQQLRPVPHQAHQPPVPHVAYHAAPAPAPSNGWGKVLLACMAVAGLGGGLGVLVRKAVRHDAGSWFGADAQPGAAAAAAAEARREASAMAADVAHVKRNADKTQEKLDTVLRALDRLQASVDVHTRAVERVEDRVRSLENKPSIESIKADIMSGVSQSVSTAINHHTLSEVKQEMAAIRSLIDGKGLALSPQMTQISSAASTAPTEPQEPQGQGKEQKVEKAPAGLPNARIFRKLNASPSPSATAAPTAAPSSNSPAPASSSSAPSANASTLSAPATASPFVASSVHSAHKAQDAMPGQEISDSSSAEVAGSMLHQSREAPAVRADDAGDGVTPLPQVLRQHLEAAGVHVSTPLPEIESGEAPVANGGERRESQSQVPGAAAGSAAEASCIEAGKHADAAEAESSVFLQGAHAAPKGENSQAAAQSTLQTDEGDARGAPRQQAPYSANFKEVMGMVRAGKVPPDVATVDDTPISNASHPAPPPPDSRKPRAKPWERNLSGNKAAIVTAAPAPAPSVSPFGPPGADGSVVINPVSNGGGGLPIEALPFQPAGWGGEVDRDAGSVSQATRPLP